MVNPALPASDEKEIPEYSFAMNRIVATTAIVPPSDRTNPSVTMEGRAGIKPRNDGMPRSGRAEITPQTISKRTARNPQPCQPESLPPFPATLDPEYQLKKLRTRPITAATSVMRRPTLILRNIWRAFSAWGLSCPDVLPLGVLTITLRSLHSISWAAAYMA